jgi:hypothetical protein
MFLLLAIAADTLVAADTSVPPLNPHSLPTREAMPQCLTCHAEAEQAVTTVKVGLAPTMVRDGIKSCITCHESAAVKHMVGRRPDFKVPSYLPLDAEGRITCLTCHYTHGPLSSEKTWVDVSWIERLTNSERLHKTFLLRHHNRDGHLCKACHDS